MGELQKNLETKLTNIQAAITTLKEEIPRSIGQNLMSFSDMIGAKIEDMEESIKRITISSGGTADPTIGTVKQDLGDIKTSIKNLQTAIQSIKIEAAATSPHITLASPISAPTIPKSSSLPSPPPTAPTTPHLTPIPVSPSQPAPAPARVSSVKTTPSSSAPAEGPGSDVTNLLDTIKQKAKSGLSAIALANEMEQIRDTIVKVYRWHPALYELATFARRLKKFPEGAPPDAELFNLLLEKVEEWKNRVSG